MSDLFYHKIIYDINQLYHYSHRVGHLIFTSFHPIDAQNDSVGSRLWGLFNKKLTNSFFRSAAPVVVVVRVVDFM